MGFSKSMLPKLWKSSETNCPFCLRSDGNKKRSARANFSSSVPHASARLAVAPYLMSGFEAYKCSLYVQACSGNASTFLCVRMEYEALILVHTGVRTTGRACTCISCLCMAYVIYLVPICTCQTGRTQCQVPVLTLHVGREQ